MNWTGEPRFSLLHDKKQVSRLLLTLLSCAFLAWSLHRVLTGVTVARPAVFTYTVAVAPHAAQNSEARSNEVWVHSVLADGRLLRHEDLVQTGTWVDEGGSLVHRDSAESATIRFQARRATIVFLTSAWSGFASVEGTDGLAWQGDLFHREQEETTFSMVDFADGGLVPQGIAHRLPSALALGAVLLIVLAWRPWRSSAAIQAWAVAYVGTLHALVWLTQAVGVNSDTIGYLRSFSDFMSGYASYFPPGYPIFLGGVQAIFPTVTGSAVTAVQHVWMVLSLLAIRQLSRAFLPTDLATFGFMFTGSLAPTLFLPQAALSENLALVGMAGTLWLTFRRRPASGVVGDVVAGLPAGWAALARVVPLAAVALPVLLLRVAASGLRLRPAMRTGLVLVGGALPVVIAATWIWHRSDEFTVANSQNVHLYNRVVTEQLLLNRDGARTRELLALTGDAELRDTPHWDMSARLAATGLGMSDADQLMGDVAREGIMRHPLQFLSYGLGMAWREYGVATAEPIPAWARDTEPTPAVENEPLLGLRSSAILWRRDLNESWAQVWPMLMWAPFASMVFLPVLRSRLVILAVLAVPAGYLFTTSCVDFFLDRHVLCVLPFALAVAPVPVVGCLGAWRRLRFRTA